MWSIGEGGREGGGRFGCDKVRGVVYDLLRKHFAPLWIEKGVVLSVVTEFCLKMLAIMLESLEDWLHFWNWGNFIIRKIVKVAPGRNKLFFWIVLRMITIFQFRKSSWNLRDSSVWWGNYDMIFWECVMESCRENFWRRIRNGKIAGEFWGFVIIMRILWFDFRGVRSCESGFE